ncbi:MAG: c-type cytochrome [Desulfobacterales bacterium]|nr:c-type cytochrome [Desulfobacterales bacterium]
MIRRWIIFGIGILCLAIFLTGCEYDPGMREQPIIKPHEEPVHHMVEGIVPFGSSEEIYRKTDPKILKNPIAYNAEAVALGKIKYGMYCVMCHGIKADGMGSVGQSFNPLPTDLLSSKVQQKTDGELFNNISFGQKREPALATTVSVEDRWKIIIYLRSMVDS